MDKLTITQLNEDDIKKIMREVLEVVIKPSKSSNQIFNSDQRFMTVRQVAESLQLSTSFVRNLTKRDPKDNPLPMYSFGRAIRYFWPEVLEWIHREKELQKNL